MVERWILHKLNVAAVEINKAFAERNFMAATNVAYNFWLYELCDVYIVSRQRDPNHMAHLRVGSHETDDRPIRHGGDAAVSPEHVVHLP